MMIIYYLKTVQNVSMNLVYDNALLYVNKLLINNICSKNNYFQANIVLYVEKIKIDEFFSIILYKSVGLKNIYYINISFFAYSYSFIEKCLFL